MHKETDYLQPRGIEPSIADFQGNAILNLEESQKWPRNMMRA